MKPKKADDELKERPRSSAPIAVKPQDDSDSEPQSEAEPAAEPENTVSSRQPKLTDEDDVSGGGGSVAAIAISVVIIVLVAAAAAFLVLRTRLAPRLRARLTNTPYEDIVIGRQGRSESQQNVIA